MESETEDGKIRTEGQLKREVINGVGSLLAYYRYVQNYPDNEKDIQPLSIALVWYLYCYLIHTDKLSICLLRWPEI